MDESEGLPATLLSIINDFFEVGDFEIKNVSGQRDIHVQSNTLSLYLSILPGQYIYIHNIEKCSQLTGTEKLKRVIDFGKHIKVKYIRLYDGSCVASNTCLFIALASFEILTTGNSWYNKFGFRSPTSDLEESYNKFIGRIPFEKLINFDRFLTYIIHKNNIHERNRHEHNRHEHNRREHNRREHNRREYEKYKILLPEQIKKYKNNRLFLKGLSNGIQTGFIQHFSEYARQYFSRHFSQHFSQHLSEDFSEDFKEDFSEDLPIKSTRNLLLEFKSKYLNKNPTPQLSKEQCNIIEDLTLYLDGIICYDHNLQLELPSRFGGKSKTKNRMSRRPRKYSLQPMHSMKHKKGTRKSRK